MKQKKRRKWTSLLLALLFLLGSLLDFSLPVWAVQGGRSLGAVKMAADGAQDGDFDEDEEAGQGTGSETSGFEAFAMAGAQMVKEADKENAALSGNSGMDALNPLVDYLSARLIVRGESGLDFSKLHPKQELTDGNGLYLLQFNTPAEAKYTCDTISGRAKVKWANPDTYVDGYAGTAGESAAGEAVADGTAAGEVVARKAKTRFPVSRAVS